MKNETYMDKKRREQREEIIYWIKCAAFVFIGMPVLVWTLTVLCAG